MKKQFKQLCAEPRSLKPLCKNLEFDKCAKCTAGIKLAQFGLELGPDHRDICEKFVPVGQKDEEKKSTTSDSKKYSSNKKDKKSDKSDKEDEILEEEDKN